VTVVTARMILGQSSMQTPAEVITALFDGYRFAVRSLTWTSRFAEVY
jgi:hypothetical protein